MANIRQSGREPGASRIVAPSAPDFAGIGAKMKRAKFVYWTAGGERKEASGDTSGRINFSPPLKTIAQALGGLDDYTVAGAAAKMAETAEIIQLEMQENAPWEDRGKTAREALVATVRQSKNNIALVAGYDLDYLLTFQLRDRIHGTFPRDYSVFLETMQGGRFAIVKPTLESYYGDFMGQFNQMWNDNSAINKSFTNRRQAAGQQAFQNARLQQLRNK